MSQREFFSDWRKDQEKREAAKNNREQKKPSKVKKAVSKAQLIAPEFPPEKNSQSD